MKKILIIGASGQIGSDLTVELRKLFGSDHVVASDIKSATQEVMQGGPFESLDVMDKKRISEVIDKHGVTEVYHLAAILSGNAEKNPKWAWNINMDSLFNVLDISREKKIKKIFWPSSMGAFGPSTPPINTPQLTIMEPSTVYGISKLAGERWCEYYYKKYGLDIRSLRYPGLISWKAEAGGGTTDYAVEIFYAALSCAKYECFLTDDMTLPMMYMEDAVNATIKIMEAPEDKIKIRSSYNLGGISFSPKEIATEIRKYIPQLEMTYKPDFRQAIAESWPRSINDKEAQKDWGWKHEYDLERLTKVMIENISKKIHPSS